MTPEWQFVQDDHAKWRWKRIDDARGEIASPESFENQLDCVLDAVRFAIQQCRSRQQAN